MSTAEMGLGRLPSEDPRDRNFPMQALLREAEPKRTYRYWWPHGWWGDQGATPQCVAYSWLHFIEDGPVTHVPRGENTRPALDPQWVYDFAQENDEWAGTDYDGTSVRAGAKALQHAGFIAGYYWAHDIDPIIDALLQRGPVVVGTIWTRSMFYPDPETAVIQVDGPSIGGHAYVLDGVNVNKRLFRIKNSWGRLWGRKGFAYLRFDDLTYLLERHGEACIAAEIDRAKL